MTPFHGRRLWQIKLDEHKRTQAEAAAAAPDKKVVIAEDSKK